MAIMRGAFVIIVLLLIAAAALVFILFDRSRDSAALELEYRRETDPRRSIESAAAPGAASESRAENTNDRRAGDAAAAEPILILHKLTGKLIYEGGLPAPGKTVSAEYLYSDEPPPAQKRPGDPIPILTNAGGEFELLIAEAENAYVKITIRADDIATMERTYDWQQLKSIETEDAKQRIIRLSDITVLAGGNLHGKLLLANGRPFGAGGTVRVESQMYTFEDENALLPLVARTRKAEPDADSGEFTISGLVPGVYRFQSRDGDGWWSSGPLVIIHIGQTTELEYRSEIEERRPRAFVKLKILDQTTPISINDVTAIIHPGNNEVSAEPAGSGEYIFYGNGATASIVVSSYLYEDVQLSNVPLDGRRVEVSLKRHPVCSLTIELVDATTQAAIPNAQIRFRDKIQGVPEVIKSGERIDGVPARDTVIFLEKDSYITRSNQITNLRPGEHRTEKIQLDPSFSAGGKLVVKNGGRVPAPEHIYSDSSNDAQLPQPNAVGTFNRSNNTFNINGLQAGTHQLNFQFSGGRSVATEISVGKDKDNSHLEIEVPPEYTIRGKLTTPEGISFVGARVTALVHPLAEESEELSLSSPIAPDGSFQFTIAGDATVRLNVQFNRRFEVKEIAGDANDAFSIFLGEFTASHIDGETKIFNISDRLPATLIVHLRVNGRPEPFYAMVATNSEHGRRRSVMGATDAHGIAKIEHVTPGIVNLEVLIPDRTSAWILPKITTLTAGQSLQLPVDISIIEKRVLLEDPDGRPLANCSFTLVWLFGDSDYLPRQLTTDARGMVTISAPEGALTFKTLGPENYFLVKLKWDADTAAAVRLQEK